MANIHWSKEEDDILKKYYNPENVELVLPLLLRRTRKAIWDHARLLGLSNKLEKRVYKKNVFKTWTEESAYWLGFLYADGSMAKDLHAISLEISKKDLDHISKFRDWVSPGAKIYERTRGKLTFVNYQISNTIICKRLFNLGLIPNKSMKSNFPKAIPKEYYRHFIRGLSDGDGSVGSYIRKGSKGKDLNWSLLASEKILLKIKEIVKEELDIDINIYYQDSKNMILTYIHVSHLKAQKILNWLYKDSNIFLERKYIPFVEYTKILSERELEKQKPKVKRVKIYSSEVYKKWYYQNQNKVKIRNQDYNKRRKENLLFLLFRGIKE